MTILAANYVLPHVSIVTLDCTAYKMLGFYAKACITKMLYYLWLLSVSEEKCIAMC